MSAAAIYLAAVALAQVASLVLLPIITHYLAPAEYGEYAVVLAATGLVGTFGSSWIRNVAMRLHFDVAREGRTAQLFLTAAVMQAILLSLLLVPAFALTQFAGPVGVVTFLAGAASVLVADLYALCLNVVRAGQRAVRFGVAELMSSGLRVAATWIGLAAGFRSAAMLFVFATGGVLIGLAVAWPGARRVLSAWQSPSRALARQVMRLGLPSLPHAVGTWVIAMSDRLLLSYFLDLGAVGIYAVASGLADRALTGLATGLFMMTWPAILHAWTDRREQVPEIVGRYLGMFVLLSVGPAVFLGWYRAELLALLVGPEYLAAAPVIPWIVVGAWLLGLAGYLNRSLELTLRYGTLSGITITAAMVNGLLNVVLIPTFGVVGAAMSTAAAGACMAVGSAALGRRVLPLPLPWRPIGWSIVALLCALGAGALVTEPIASMVAFLASYCAIALHGWRRSDFGALERIP